MPGGLHRGHPKSPQPHREAAPPRSRRFLAGFVPSGGETSFSQSPEVPLPCGRDHHRPRTCLPAPHRTPRTAPRAPQRGPRAPPGASGTEVGPRVGPSPAASIRPRVLPLTRQPDRPRPSRAATKFVCPARRDSGLVALKLDFPVSSVLHNTDCRHESVLRVHNPHQVLVYQGVLSV